MYSDIKSEVYIEGHTVNKEPSADEATSRFRNKSFNQESTMKEDFFGGRLVKNHNTNGHNKARGDGWNHAAALGSSVMEVGGVITCEVTS